MNRRFNRCSSALSLLALFLLFPGCFFSGLQINAAGQKTANSGGSVNPSPTIVPTLVPAPAPTVGPVPLPTASAAPGGGGKSFHVGQAGCVASANNICVATTGSGATEVAIGNVPWYQLAAGDTVYIHYRTTGGRNGDGVYHEKFTISSRGTETQWIRVLGVPGAGGELPVISGLNATTSSSMHIRWPDPQIVQWDGVVHIIPSDNGLPGYIEIANLKVQDAGCFDHDAAGNDTNCYSFTAENGTTSRYEGFAACIYSRSAQHVLIRNNVLTNCGQAFYNWTGSGVVDPCVATPQKCDSWWCGLQVDTVIRGNYFYNNGFKDSYTEHQTYTESDGVTIEYNYYGAQRSGALGSQLKDRSAGSVVRYNYIEGSPSGWDIDLVEPQEGCESLCYTKAWRTCRDDAEGNPIWDPVTPAFRNQKYLEAFVYGNVIVNMTLYLTGHDYLGAEIWEYPTNFVHWNEDHHADQGRAWEPNGRLYFYNNTIVDGGSGMTSFFNETNGSYDCPTYDLPGRIDFRNNIVYAAGGGYPLGEYCTKGRFDFGVNWVSSGYALHVAESTGATNLISGSAPGFTSVASRDFRLASGASAAAGKGAALPGRISSGNYLGLDFSPRKQLAKPSASIGVPTSTLMLPSLIDRSTFGTESDLGAFQR